MGNNDESEGEVDELPPSPVGNDDDAGQVGVESDDKSFCERIVVLIAWFCVEFCTETTICQEYSP